MFSNAMRLSVGLSLAALWLVYADSAQAQFNVRQVPSTVTVPLDRSPYFYVAPGVTQAQYLNTIAQTARVASQIPPWLYGYNPYPSPIVSSYPPINYNPIYSPYAPGLSGYGAGGIVNPYAAGAGAAYGATTNPYAPAGAGYSDPSLSSYAPYNPYSSPLSGAADVMRASGDLINKQEQARITREQAEQAKLETIKKKFDLAMYIKANTPTPTEIQAKNAQQTLKRIQINSNPAEIASGKSQNYLLDDLRKYPGAKVPQEPISLTDEILGRINITKGLGNIGVLRNDGRLSWPIALQEMIPPDKRKEIDNQTQSLYKSALTGRVDANLLKDFSNEMDKVREDLVKKVNDIPTTQYLEAKRFLNDCGDARIAMERGGGDVSAQAAYQRFVDGGKTIQQVVDYMVSNGLKFASCVQGDENAYSALYSGMVAYDVAVNAQMNTYEARDNPP